MNGEVLLSGSQPTFRWNEAVASEPTLLQYCSKAPVPNPVYKRFGLELIGDISLHNRPFLLNELRRDLDGDDELLCDRALTLAAYAKWGYRCPQFLLGEFAFAILDGTERRLYFCRDHMGSRPLLYFLDQCRVVVASDSRAILSLPQVPRKPNLQKLSSLVVPGGMKLYPEETFHVGIRCLPPGSWMTVDRRGTRQETYWKPEIREDLVPRRESEIFDALGELLKQAVESRIPLDGTPAALLSGGLDSSSVVSLGARYMSGSNRSLTALAAVVPDELKPQIADEREYVEEFRGFPGVRIKYVTPTGGPFDWIGDPARFETAFLRSSRGYVYDALESAAIAANANILLEGDGGEFGATNWGAPYFAELAVTGRWPSLVREMRALGRVEGSSPIRELMAQLGNFAAPYRHFRPQVLLRDDFVRSTAGSSQMVRRGFRLPNQRYQQRTELRGWLARTATRVSLFDSSRIHHSYPLLDKRVLEFCLALPGRYKVKDGYRRYLIRKTLDGILPRRIQWRTSKTPFSPDYYARYNSQLPRARQFMAEIGTGDPIRSVVDVGALNRLLQRPFVAGADFAALALIPTTIYMICFLRQFPEFRP